MISKTWALFAVFLLFTFICDAAAASRRKLALDSVAEIQVLGVLYRHYLPLNWSAKYRDVRSKEFILLNSSLCESIENALSQNRTLRKAWRTCSISLVSEGWATAKTKFGLDEGVLSSYRVKYTSKNFTNYLMNLLLAYHPPGPVYYGKIMEIEVVGQLGGRILVKGIVKRRGETVPWVLAYSNKNTTEYAKLNSSLCETAETAISYDYELWRAWRNCTNEFFSQKSVTAQMQIRFDRNRFGRAGVNYTATDFIHKVTKLLLRYRPVGPAYFGSISDIQFASLWRM